MRREKKRVCAEHGIHTADVGALVDTTKGIEPGVSLIMIAADSELKILDDFPTWSIGIIAVILAVGFLISLFVLVRSSRAKAQNARASRKSSWFSRPSLFFVVAIGLALWFLGTSMFSNFHAMIVSPKRIELVYFWPRPPKVVETADLIDVNIVRGLKTCGHMVVATREEVFRSVNFKKCNVAEEILAQLSDRAGISRYRRSPRQP
jgi:hypothetical protein